MFLLRYIEIFFLLKMLGININILYVYVVIFCKKKKKVLLGNNVDCICRLNLLIVGCSSNLMSMYVFGVFFVSRFVVFVINVDKVI